MKLQELAALAQVREHLQRIVTTSRADKSLMNLVAEMDKVFLENVRHLDLGKVGENALTLVKVSGNPTQAELEQWRKIFEEAQVDKDFAVITHDNVSVERIAYSKSDAVAIKPGEVKVLGREVVAESGQLNLNFSEKPTQKEESEIRSALTKIEKAQSQAVLDKIAKAKEHIKLTDEGAKAVIEEAIIEDVADEMVEEAVQKAAEIEVDEETKKKTEEEDEELISKRVAEAKKKLSKAKKKTTRKSKAKEGSFSRTEDK